MPDRARGRNRPDSAGRRDRPDIAGRHDRPDIAGRYERPDISGRHDRPDGAGRRDAPAGAEPANEPPERVVARYRSHGRRLVLPVLVLIADAGASAYYLGRLPEQWQNQVVTGVAVAIALSGGLLPYLSWLATRYTITTRRVIASKGLVVRERQEVSLRRGFDVVVRRRGLQALWRSGDVTVHGGGEHPLVFRDVESPGLIASALTRLGEEQSLSS